MTVSLNLAKKERHCSSILQQIFSSRKAETNFSAKTNFISHWKRIKGAPPPSKKSIFRKKTEIEFLP
jgi:hypothetical protein